MFVKPILTVYHRISRSLVRNTKQKSPPPHTYLSFPALPRVLCMARYYLIPRIPRAPLAVIHPPTDFYYNYYTPQTS